MNSWEIDLSRHSREEIKAPFDQYGVIVLRNALDGSVLPQFQTWLRDYLVLTARQIEEGAPEVEANPGLIPMVARGLAHHSLLSQHLFGDQVGLISRFADVVRGSNLEKVLSILLGPSVVLLDQYSTLRYKDPAKAEGFLPYHQDAHPNGPSTIDPPVLTCFTPFCDTGRERPGLEFLPEIVSEIVDLSEKPKTQFAVLELDEETIHAKWGSVLVAPPLNVGDVVVMNGLTIHRSQPAPASWQPRGSADLRFVDATRVPTKYSGTNGIDLSTGERIGFP